MMHHQIPGSNKNIRLFVCNTQKFAVPIANMGAHTAADITKSTPSKSDGQAGVLSRPDRSYREKMVVNQWRTTTGASVISETYTSNPASDVSRVGDVRRDRIAGAALQNDKQCQKHQPRIVGLLSTFRMVRPEHPHGEVDALLELLQQSVLIGIEN